MSVLRQPNPLGAVTGKAYEGLADWIAGRHRTGLRVLGINGSQGSGKSTLAAFLAEHLAARHGLHAVAVSLDDFYLGRAARADLAASVHPLLITRGVPGTHDVHRGQHCLHLLPRLRPGQRCALPVFSKATDEALGPEHDRPIDRAADLVLFEGWCVGTPPQASTALAQPVNELERAEDPSGAWRHYVNQQLAEPYARWFAALDALVFLQVPGWEQVRAWRAQQERETAALHSGQSVLQAPHQLERFLQHYQRLTEHAMRVLPDKADVVLSLNLEHEVDQVRYA